MLSYALVVRVSNSVTVYTQTTTALNSFLLVHLGGPKPQPGQGCCCVAAALDKDGAVWPVAVCACTALYCTVYTYTLRYALTQPLYAAHARAGGLNAKPKA